MNGVQKKKNLPLSLFSSLLLQIAERTFTSLKQQLFVASDREESFLKVFCSRTTRSNDPLFIIIFSSSSSRREVSVFCLCVVEIYETVEEFANQSIKM